MKLWYAANINIMLLQGYVQGVTGDEKDAQLEQEVEEQV